MADWAKRAGQGAFFDWAVVNAILPPVDERFNDVRKIDRTTVVEIAEIAAQYATIQAQLDNADTGANPLGLAKDVDSLRPGPGADANDPGHAAG